MGAEKLVFPTCVGVFLSPEPSGMTEIGLPHVRGGVSVVSGLSSINPFVFPTCVGVFLPFEYSEPNI